jgi:hypothetical protein
MTRIAGAFTVALLVSACSTPVETERTETQWQTLSSHQPERMCTEETCEDIDEVIVHGDGHAGTGVWWGGGDSTGGSVEPPPTVGGGGDGSCVSSDCSDPNERERAIMLDKCLRARATLDTWHSFCGFLYENYGSSVAARCTSQALTSNINKRNWCYGLWGT